METPTFGTISVIVIADIMFKEKVLASMSLDSVPGISFHLVLGQKEAHTDNIWVRKIRNEFYLRDGDCISKGVVCCSKERARVVILRQ